MSTMYQSWKDVPADKWRWKSFTPREMACKGTGRLLLDEQFMDRLQALRDMLGIPMLITSGYRSPEHNRKVGGAKGSYHLQGVAADVRMDNQDPLAFEAAARSVGFRGVGYYAKQGFMHIDLGPDRTWGTPFPRTVTALAETEPTGRDSKLQSTTIQAAATGAVAAGAQGAAAVAAFDGHAQIVAMVLTAILLLAFVWIIRERIKKWAEGIR